MDNILHRSMIKQAQEFRYVVHAARKVGDDATREVASSALLTCMAAMVLLRYNAIELARNLYATTRQADFDIDALSEEFIERTGIEYCISPEVE